MKQKRLVKVYSEDKERVWCSYCDSGEGVDTDTWYEIEKPQGLEHHLKYLGCCLQKVGFVVDWEENGSGQ